MDTLKGQVQTKFAGIPFVDATSIYGISIKGHLSVDYTCVKWLSLERLVSLFEIYELAFFSFGIIFAPGIVNYCRGKCRNSEYRKLKTF